MGSIAPMGHHGVQLFVVVVGPGAVPTDDWSVYMRSAPLNSAAVGSYARLHTNLTLVPEDPPKPHPEYRFTILEHVATVQVGLFRASVRMVGMDWSTDIGDLIPLETAFYRYEYAGEGAVLVVSGK